MSEEWVQKLHANGQNTPDLGYDMSKSMELLHSLRMQTSALRNQK